MTTRFVGLLVIATAFSQSYFCERTARHAATVYLPTKHDKYYKVVIAWNKSSEHVSDDIIKPFEHGLLVLKQHSQNGKRWKKIGKCTTGTKLKHSSAKKLKCFVPSSQSIARKPLLLVHHYKNRRNKYKRINRVTAYTGFVKTFESRTVLKMKFEIQTNSTDANTVAVLWKNREAIGQESKVDVFLDDLLLGTTNVSCSCGTNTPCGDVAFTSPNSNYIGQKQQNIYNSIGNNNNIHINDNKNSDGNNNDDNNCSVYIMNLKSCTKYKICIRISTNGKIENIERKNRKKEDQQIKHHKTTQCKRQTFHNARVQQQNGKTWNGLYIFLICLLLIAGVLLIAICMLYVLNMRKLLLKQSSIGYDSMEVAL